MHLYTTLVLTMKCNAERNDILFPSHTVSNSRASLVCLLPVILLFSRIPTPASLMYTYTIITGLEVNIFRID